MNSHSGGTKWEMIMCDCITGTSKIHQKHVAKCNFIHVLDPQRISNKTAITIEAY